MARSSKEKQSQASIFFKLGDIIRTERDDGTGPRFFIKTAHDQYSDASTGEMFHVREVADRILNPRTRVANRADVLEFRTLRQQANLHKRQIFIDTETAIRFNQRRIEKDDVYQIGYKIQGTDKHQSFVFKEIVDKMSKTRPGVASPREFMSKNLQEIYDEALTAYKAGNNVFTVQSTGMTYNIASRPEVQKHFEQYLDPKTNSMWAFNAPFDKQMMELIGIGSRKGRNVPLNIRDARGYEMMRLAQLNPTIGLSQLTHTSRVFGPVLNKLNVAKEQQDKIFMSMYQGMGSKYAKGTSLEDVYHLYRYMLGPAANRLHEAGKLPDVITQAHVAEKDVNLTIAVREMGDVIEDLWRKEQKGLLAGDNVKYLSMKERYQWGWIRNLYAREKMKDPSSVHDTVATFLKQFDSVHDQGKMARKLRAAYEFKMGGKLDKSIMGGTRGTLGGPGTVQALLSGAFLAAGVRWAAKKAETASMRGQDEVQEGMGHNSLLTVARRMSTTDFWSPVSSGFGLGALSTATAKVMRMLFAGTTKSPTGQAIKDLFGTLNQYFHGKGPTKETVKKVASGATVQKYWADIMKRFSSIGQSFSDSVRKSYWFTDKTRARVADFIETKAEEVASFADDLGRRKPGLKKGSMRKFIEDIGKKMVTKEDGRYKLTPFSTAALVGGGGALLLGASAGRYDPDKVPDPEESVERNRIFNPQRMRRTQESAVMKIGDARYSSREGIRYGSADRQMNRHTHTDFGSGVRDVLQASGQAFRPSMESAMDTAAGKIAMSLRKKRGSPTSYKRVFEQAPRSISVEGGGLVKDARNFRRLPIRQVEESFARSEQRAIIDALDESIGNSASKIQTRGLRKSIRNIKMAGRKDAIRTARDLPKVLPDVPEELIDEFMRKAPYSKQLYGGPLTGIDVQLREIGKDGGDALHQIGRRVRTPVKERASAISRNFGHIADTESVQIVPRRITEVGDSIDGQERLPMIFYGGKNYSTVEAERVRYKMPSLGGYVAGKEPPQVTAPDVSLSYAIRDREMNPRIENIVDHLSTGPYPKRMPMLTGGRMENVSVGSLNFPMDRRPGFALNEIAYNTDLNRRAMQPINRRGWAGGSSMFDDRPEIYMSKSNIIT